MRRPRALGGGRLRPRPRVVAAGCQVAILCAGAIIAALVIAASLLRVAGGAPFAPNAFPKMHEVSP